MVLAAPALMCLHAACATIPTSGGICAPASGSCSTTPCLASIPSRARMRANPGRHIAGSLNCCLQAVSTLRTGRHRGLLRWNGAAITVALRHLIQRLQADFSVVVAAHIRCLLQHRPHVHAPAVAVHHPVFRAGSRHPDACPQDRASRANCCGCRDLCALEPTSTSSSSTAFWCLALALAEAMATRWNIGEKTRLRAPGMVARIRWQSCGDAGQSLRLAHLPRRL